MKVRPIIPVNSFLCAAACTAKIQTASTAPMMRCFSDISPPAFPVIAKEASDGVSRPIFPTRPDPLHVHPFNYRYQIPFCIDEGLYRPRQGVAIIRRNATSTFFIPPGSSPPGLGYLSQRGSGQPAKHVEQRRIRGDLQIEIHQAVEQDTSTSE